MERAEGNDQFVVSDGDSSHQHQPQQQQQQQQQVAQVGAPTVIQRSNSNSHNRQQDGLNDDASDVGDDNRNRNLAETNNSNHGNIGNDNGNDNGKDNGKDNDNDSSDEEGGDETDQSFRMEAPSPLDMQHINMHPPSYQQHRHPPQQPGHAFSPHAAVNGFGQPYAFAQFAAPPVPTMLSPVFGNAHTLSPFQHHPPFPVATATVTPSPLSLGAFTVQNPNHHHHHHPTQAHPFSLPHSGSGLQLQSTPPTPDATSAPGYDHFAFYDFKVITPSPQHIDHDESCGDNDDASTRAKTPAQTQTIFKKVRLSDRMSLQEAMVELGHQLKPKRRCETQNDGTEDTRDFTDRIESITCGDYDLWDNAQYTLEDLTSKSTPLKDVELLVRLRSAERVERHRDDGESKGAERGISEDKEAERMEQDGQDAEDNGSTAQDSSMMQGDVYLPHHQQQQQQHGDNHAYAHHFAQAHASTVPMSPATPINPFGVHPHVAANSLGMGFGMGTTSPVNFSFSQGPPFHPFQPHFHSHPHHQQPPHQPFPSFSPFVPSHQGQVAVPHPSNSSNAGQDTNLHYHHYQQQQQQRQQQQRPLGQGPGESNAQRIPSGPRNRQQSGTHRHNRRKRHQRDRAAAYSHTNHRNAITFKPHDSSSIHRRPTNEGSATGTANRSGADQQNQLRSRDGNDADPDVDGVSMDMESKDGREGRRRRRKVHPQHSTVAANHDPVSGNTSASGSTSAPAARDDDVMCTSSNENATAHASMTNSSNKDGASAHDSGNRRRRRKPFRYNLSSGQSSENDGNGRWGYASTRKKKARAPPNDDSLIGKTPLAALHEWCGKRQTAPTFRLEELASSGSQDGAKAGEESTLNANASASGSAGVASLASGVKGLVSAGGSHVDFQFTVFVHERECGKGRGRNKAAARQDAAARALTTLKPGIAFDCETGVVIALPSIDGVATAIQTTTTTSTASSATIPTSKDGKLARKRSPLSRSTEPMEELAPSLAKRLAIGRPQLEEADKGNAAAKALRGRLKHIGTSADEDHCKKRQKSFGVSDVCTTNPLPHRAQDGDDAQIKSIIESSNQLSVADDAKQSIGDKVSGTSIQRCGVDTDRHVDCGSDEHNINDNDDEEEDEDAYLASRGASACSTLLHAMFQIDERIRTPPSFSYSTSRTTSGTASVTSTVSLPPSSSSSPSMQSSATKPVVVLHKVSFTCVANLVLHHPPRRCNHHATQIDAGAAADSERSVDTCDSAKAIACSENDEKPDSVTDQAKCDCDCSHSEDRVETLEAVGTSGSKRDARYIASAKLLAKLFPDCNGMVQVKRAAEAAREQFAVRKTQKRKVRRRMIAHQKMMSASSHSPHCDASRTDADNDAQHLHLGYALHDPLQDPPLLQSDVACARNSDVPCRPNGTAQHKRTGTANVDTSEARVLSRQKQLVRQVGTALALLNEYDEEGRSRPIEITENDVGRTILRQATVDDIGWIQVQLAGRKDASNSAKTTTSANADADAASGTAAKKTTLHAEKGTDTLASTSTPMLNLLLDTTHSRDGPSDKDATIVSKPWSSSTFVLLLCLAIAPHDDPPLGCAMLMTGFSMTHGKVLRVVDLLSEPHLPRERFVECLSSFAEYMSCKLELGGHGAKNVDDRLNSSISRMSVSQSASKTLVANDDEDEEWKHDGEQPVSLHLRLDELQAICDSYPGTRQTVRELHGDSGETDASTPHTQCQSTGVGSSGNAAEDRADDHGKDGTGTKDEMAAAGYARLERSSREGRSDDDDDCDLVVGVGVDAGSNAGSREATVKHAEEQQHGQRRSTVSDKPTKRSRME